MKYLEKDFCGFYMKRELNRDFEMIEKLHGWCKENGKKFYLLANSGCLNFCSAHNFHDNLVAHEEEISKTLKEFKLPERFYSIGDEINAIRFNPEKDLSR